MNNLICIKDKLNERNQENTYTNKIYSNNNNFIIILNFYELYVFIDVCCKYMELLKTKSMNEYIYQNDFYNDIELKRYEIDNLIKIIKYLTCKFRDCDYICDIEIELNLDSIYLLLKAFESQSEKYLNLYINSNHDDFKYKYLYADQLEKTILYFYKELIDTSLEYINKFSISRFNKYEYSKTTYFKQYLDSKNNFLSPLEYFKDLYINEYLSHDTLIYENTIVTNDLNNYNLSIYFIKPSKRIENRIRSSKSKTHPNFNITYMSKEDIDNFMDTYDLFNEDLYKYGEGYRIELNSLRQETFYNNINNYSGLHYHEARNLYDLNNLKNLSFTKGLEVNIIQRKDINQLESKRSLLFETIFNCIEQVIFTYQGDSSIYSDKFISQSLCDILKEYYF